MTGCLENSGSRDLFGSHCSVSILTAKLVNQRKRAGVAQCTAGDFQGRVCESVEVCPAYAGLDRCRLISGRTSSITVSSAIALPKAASSRSSS
jgi:hypothetical protein